MAENWEEFIAGVTYKPGYRIELISEDRKGAHVHVVTPPLPDSRVPGTDARFIQEYDLPAFKAKTAVEDFREHVLRAYEGHELDEWYLVDGERVDDPHDGAPMPMCYVAPEDLPSHKNEVPVADEPGEVVG